uniref:Integrase zinc-binding domain-containing protein n=1 Tax=Parascaris univalens TaxID=6257 RepID=A0A915AVU5_PARUN
FDHLRHTAHLSIHFGRSANEGTEFDLHFSLYCSGVGLRNSGINFDHLRHTAHLSIHFGRSTNEETEFDLHLSPHCSGVGLRNSG